MVDEVNENNEMVKEQNQSNICDITIVFKFKQMVINIILTYFLNKMKSVTNLMLIQLNSW